MSKRNHSPGPVPPGNQPHVGPAFKPGDEEEQPVTGEETPPMDQEQDPKRRIGGFVGKGEHSRQQPSQLNDGNTRSE